jgi:hypothetical protein
MTSHDPPESLKAEVLTVIRQSDLAAPVIELGEGILDSTLSDDLLRDIPVLSTLAAFNRLRISISDRLLVRKLARLLRQLDGVPVKDREEFARRLADDPSFQDRVLTHLILLLDRLDDMDKADLIGRAFRALVLGKINQEQFSRLAAGIDRSHIADLRELGTIRGEVAIQGPWTFPLAAVSLLEPDWGDEGYLQIDHYKLAELGRLFRAHCLA